MARAVLRRTLLREQGAAVNPQDRDDVADVMMQETGVVDPETMEPQGMTEEPQPGMLRVYNRQGKKTRAVINPMAHPKAMVLSRRALTKTLTDRERATIEDLAEAIHNMWMGWAVHVQDKVDRGTRRRWQPMLVPYSDLPETEKAKDRVEAIAFWDLMQEKAIQKSAARISAIPLRKAESGEHWITIHPHGIGANANGEEIKGRHVLIDGDGKIVGGAVPKSAQGKHITNWWKDQGKAEPKLHEHLRGHSIAFTHHEAGLETGHGYREGKNKWGNPEAEPGHVKVLAGGNVPPGYVGLQSAFADKDRIKALGAKFGPQIGVNTKAWYLPIEKIPKLLKEMPHSAVTSLAIARYEAWAQAHTESTKSAAIKKVEAAAAQQAEIPKPFQLPAGMKREAMMHGDLHNYQKAGVQFLLDQKRAILGHGVGLGKTLESITAARAAQEKGAGTFLILCPSSRKYGWQDEIQKFSDASSVVLDASLTPKQQQARWAEIDAKKPQFIITNYETLQKPELADKLHALAPNVIADEAHRVKNSKAKTTKGFQQWKDAQYAWLLTATPFPNGQPAETYTMLSHTQPGVVGSWKQFAHDHVVFQEVKTPFGRIQKPVALKNVPQLREKLQKVVQIKQMTDPDVGLQLPDRRRVDVRLDMTKEQSKMYHAMADQIAGDIAGMSDEDFQRASAQVLVRLKRLEQIALDPDLVRTPEQRTGDLSPKESWAVETITDHLSDPKNRGMVVFCDTRLPLEKVYAALTKDGITAHKITGSESSAQRQETERQFSTGKVQVVLATSAAEEGMNLQHGSHTLIHLDVPWVPKSITQREGRVHRQGQPNPFTTHFHVTHSRTVEDTKQGTLHTKARDIDALLGTHQAEDLAIGHTLSRQDVLAMLGHKEVKKSGPRVAQSHGGAASVPLTKSRIRAVVVKAGRNTQGQFIPQRGSASKPPGWRPNPRRVQRPQSETQPREAGHALGSPMQESSMQVLGAITQSRRRSPQADQGWGFDPRANLPGNTGQPQPVGKPGVFLYKSDPAIRQALDDYRALLEHGKSPATAIQLVHTRYPWVQDFDSTRGRAWWAAVRRADLPRPAAFTDLDTEIDPDEESGSRPKRVVFWKQTPANLGQGIMGQTGSGGAGR